MGIAPAGETLGAEHLGIECLRVFGLKVLVRKVNQDDQAAEVLEVEVRQVNVALHAADIGLFHCHPVGHALVQSRHQGQLGSVALSLVMGENRGRHQRGAFALHVHIGSVLVEEHGVVVVGGVETVEFVTHETDAHERSVGLGHLYQATDCRIGKCLNAHEC